VLQDFPFVICLDVAVVFLLRCRVSERVLPQPSLILQH
jgi:hypothetical protein